MKSRILLLIAASLLFGANLSYGYAVTLNNPSFEDDALASGAYILSATGWTGENVFGTWEPNTGFNSMPGGPQIGFVNGSNGSISQTTTEKLQAGYTYTLGALVGFRNTGTPFAGGTIQLWAGTHLLDELEVSTANSNAPTAGNWVQRQLEFTATNATLGLGDFLKVRFAGLSGGSGTHQTNFDNFSLTAVPLPAAAWLFGSALLGLGWTKRFRRQSQDALIA